MSLLPSFFRGKNYAHQINESNKAMASALIAIQTQANTPNVPDKVFIERDENNMPEYSETPPSHWDSIFTDLFSGFYGKQNYLKLFHCLPEIFAPINEIASRVADANWQLCTMDDDDVIYDDQDFNRLFSSPNPLQDIRKLVYYSVVYEILAGRQFFYYNLSSVKPKEFDIYKKVFGWFNLQAEKVICEQVKDEDPYSATEINDYVRQWKEPNINGQGNRVFETQQVIPILHLDPEAPFDLNKAIPMIKGADKAIRNLIPVYEARGVIYLKRGALGFIVSEKKDATGTVNLTNKDKKELRQNYNAEFGLSIGKDPIAISGAPVRFERTSMSIEELQPFDETLADAIAIYKVLRVPRHFVPTKDNSTFANADNDTRSFYSDVIIPWAEKYAKLWSDYLFKKKDKWIRASYDHVKILQADEKIEADTLKVNSDTAVMLYEKGVITKSRRNAIVGEEAEVKDGDTYVTDGKSTEPLVVKLGVGGLTALQAVLANTTMSEEAKKNVLIIVFGIADADAAKMVIPDEPAEPDPNADPNNPDPNKPVNDKVDEPA